MNDGTIPQGLSPQLLLLTPTNLITGRNLRNKFMFQHWMLPLLEYKTEYWRGHDLWVSHG